MRAAAASLNDQPPSKRVLPAKGIFPAPLNFEAAEAAAAAAGAGRRWAQQQNVVHRSNAGRASLCVFGKSENSIKITGK